MPSTHAAAAALLLAPPTPPPAQVLAAGAKVNINDQVLAMYLEHLLPEVAAPGDDHNYGSAAMHDVTVLQVGAGF